MKTEKLANQRSLKNKISKIFNIVAQVSLVFYYTLGPALLLAPKQTMAANPDVNPTYQYTLEGQRKNGSWTTGNICSGGGACYAEGENVPFRLIIDHVVAGSTYWVKVRHDYKNNAGIIGYDNFHDLTSADGSATGLSFTDIETPNPPATTTYKLNFTAQETEVTLNWLSLLGEDAHEYGGGSSLHVRLHKGINGGNAGDHAVPINPGDLIKRELSVQKTDSVDPVELGSNTTYTISIDNSGEQAETVTVTDVLPSQFIYVDGSGNPAPSAVSPDHRTITWTGVAVPRNPDKIITFDAQAVAGGTGTNTVSVAAEGLDTVQAQQSTTVRITHGSLKVIKKVVGGSAKPSDFGFRIQGWVDDYTFPSHGQDFVLFENLKPGTYSVEEKSATDYKLTNDCLGIKVVAGETAKCTMTNTYVPPPPPEPLTVIAYKLVCDNESDLPNWGEGDGPALITPAVVESFLGQGCHYAAGWDFQWNYADAANPGDNTGLQPDWNTFDTATGADGIATVEIDKQELGDANRLWFREAWQDDYIRFSGSIQPPYDDVSAEMYCNNDILNYDNYEWLNEPELDHTYYCVAFNVRQTGEVTFEKKIVGEGDPNDWTFTVDGNTYANGKTVSLPTGVYTVIENGPDGYTNTGVDGICSQDATRASALGARLTVTTEGGTCTFINEQDTGKIIVHKNVIDPENNDTSDNHTFAVRVDGADQKPVSESTVAAYDNVPVGEYVITEVPDADYDLVSITNNGYIKVKSGQTTIVDVVNKQKYAQLIIEKDVRSWDGVDVSDSAVFNAHVLNEEQGYDKKIDIADGAPALVEQIIPGQYTVREDGSEDYIVQLPHPVDVTLASNEKKVIIIQNNQDRQEVTLEKTDDPDTVQAGNLLTYTLSWHNTGNAPVNGLTLTDTIPENTMFVSASDEGSYDDIAKTVMWDLGYQLPGVSGSVTLTVAVASPLRDGTMIFNSDASLFSKETKPVYASAETTVTSDFNVILTKSAIDLTNPGTKIDYTLNWSVSGNSPIDSLIITDPIPENTTFAPPASDNGTESGGIVTWDLGAHNPGDSGFVTVTVQTAWPLADGTVIVNNAELCGLTETAQIPELDIVREDGNVISHCAPAKATTTITSSPILTVVKSDTPDPVAAGGELTYEMAWSVSGNSPATNVVITDTLPVDTTFVSADNSGSYDVATRTVTWALGNKVPPDSGIVMLKVTVAGTVLDGTNIANTVTIDSTENVPVTDSENTLVTNVPILTLTKTVDTTKAVNPGDEVNYTVTVKNAGYATAKNLVLNDVMPTALYYSDVLGSSRTFVSGGDLAIGDTLTFTYPVTVKTGTADGDYVNTATLTSDNYKTLTAQATVAVTQGAVKGETAVPKLKIEKSVDVAFANPGDTVTYTVKISNTGEAPTDLLVLGDILPTGFSFVDTGGTTRNWDLGTLAQGKSVTVKYEVDIATSVKAGNYENIATASADNTDPATAKKKLEVKSGTVLGAETSPELPQTGAGLMDYLVFGSALLVLAGSAFGLRRTLRRPQVKRS